MTTQTKSARLDSQQAGTWLPRSARVSTSVYMIERDEQGSPAGPSSLYNPYVRWLILFASLATNLSAQQVITGTIAGTITDPDGRAVPRIPVQAADMATKVVYRTTASATGEYSIAQLPAGTYQLTALVSTAAFLPFVRNDLRITPGQSSPDTRQSPRSRCPTDPAYR